MNDTLEHEFLCSAEDQTLTAACKRLLQQQSFATQNDLRLKLIDIGFEGISQSTVSRLLSNLGVVKVQNACGKKVYCITVESAPVRVESSIASQIEVITHNQSMVVVKTHPGSAQLVARLVDIDPHTEILGTVGGNDTVLIIPKNVNNIDACEAIVRARLGVK
ncbi:arginine repressor [Vibrio genomosp. F10 str. 9ZC157]|uniref:Arginine repressor n=1 Tax=Vibrio genomosp. F10 str. ZF-129 TaxID=1187848 RepID=A0A1E5BAP8_9VIBR|nr:arginine repressor [Vibrio genomosp. F10]OEE31078.1 arginine repressor [Vibrio genomosp. F10 str. ZF-129]OEE98491.1 arginine repressor [Vibrio genomosp. F10 str. 9ZC157]